MMKFVEVQAPDGKAYRFAAGTKARFAAERISARLQLPSSEYLLLEAICPGEEPVEFGPDAELTHLDDGWKLRALSRQGSCSSLSWWEATTRAQSGVYI
ncbi:hypothetical protein KP509_15G040000 [Ceratopteris richardii]|uniref:Uncharacterized protein n=1 Tax=Ceratopteris richardii TaxID=49495 RepID=A0A8T2T6C0_CERRI|nr:hypothetical protein KP509_15G040000 [Ceratopteris richardii]